MCDWDFYDLSMAKMNISLYSVTNTGIYCMVIFVFLCSYKHAFDGLWKVYKNEGIRCLFGGATMASSRAVLVTVGQVGWVFFKGTSVPNSGFCECLVFTSSYMYVN